MELRKVSDKVYYIKNSTNIGVVTNGSSAILIDSGLDGDTAKRVLQLLAKEGLTVKALINTHSHADHCGGNYFLKQHADIKIFAPEKEAAIVENPYFEPFFLFSGANPPKPLQNKFLMAKSSPVDYALREGEDAIEIEGMKLDIVPLPGHSLNQIGLAIEGVLFCADFVFSKEVLSKHGIPFCVDIEKQRKSLLEMKSKNYKLYIPSHGDPTEDLTEMVEAYLEVIARVTQDIAEGLSAPRSTEQVFCELCALYGINIRSMQQYYLMMTAVTAYLSYLSNEGVIRSCVENNLLLWQKC